MKINYEQFEKLVDAGNEVIDNEEAWINDHLELEFNGQRAYQAETEAISEIAAEDDDLFDEISGLFCSALETVLKEEALNGNELDFEKELRTELSDKGCMPYRFYEELEDIFKWQHTTLDRALEGRDLFYEVESHENQETDGYVMVEYKEGQRVNMAKCYVKVRLEDYDEDEEDFQITSYQLDYEKGWK